MLLFAATLQFFCWKKRPKTRLLIALIRTEPSEYLNDGVGISFVFEDHWLSTIRFGCANEHFQAETSQPYSLKNILG